jgi:hypothetical protein
VKLGLYDKKNQEASRFWWNADLADRQSKHLLFGSGSTSGVLDDVDDENDIDFIFGRGCLSLDAEGELKVPKPEPLELDEHDHRHMYRARVLEGDLPLVLVAPILWGPIVVSEGSEGGEVLQVVVDEEPCVELKDAEGGKKRKRAEAGEKLTSMSKRGGHGRGRARGSMVDHVAMAKVAASSAASPVAAARPGTVISLEPWTSMVGGLYLVVKCQVSPGCLFCK